MLDEKTIIAKRVAQEMHDGDLVNLGIGLPTMVPQFLSPDIEVFLQSENGIVGMAAPPSQEMIDPALTDAGGGPTGAIPGAASLDSTLSFGLIRGGHLDVTVLGGLQVDEEGLLANWKVPGKMVPGMGGAMDLVTGAKRVIVSMTHTAKGKAKIIKKCTLPLTSVRRVDLIVTEMAVLKPVDGGLEVLELAPGVTREALLAATEAKLIMGENIPTMNI